MNFRRELDSFMRKFRSLCDAGFQASLNFNPVNGEAHLSLNVNLGCAVSGTFPSQYSSSQDYKSPRKRPPSYYRRQQRRHQSSITNSTEKVAIDDDVIEDPNLHKGIEEIVVVNVDDSSATSHSNGDSINDICTVDGNAVEEKKNLVKINNDEPRVSLKPLDQTSSKPIDMQTGFSSLKKKYPTRSCKQVRPSPRPNPDCCNHECYPESDAPNGRCCWHRCGRIPWQTKQKL